jgi:hypothetical protein
MCEPLGASVALLAGAFDRRVRCVVACNGLLSFRSVLDGQCVHVPHDAIVPDALWAGDLPELGAAIIRSGRKLIVSGLRDGANRRATTERVRALWGAQSFQPDERSVLRDLVRELTEASL